MTRIYNELFSKNPAFRQVLEGLSEGDVPMGCYGLAEAAIAPAVDTIVKDQARPVLLVTYDLARAKKLAEDLSYYAEEGVYQLQARELFFFQRDAGSNELLSARLKTLQAMLDGRAKVVVTTPEALGGIFLEPAYLQKAAFSLEVGDEVDTEALTQSYWHRATSGWILSKAWANFPYVAASSIFSRHKTIPIGWSFSTWKWIPFAASTPRPSAPWKMWTWRKFFPCTM